LLSVASLAAMEKSLPERLYATTQYSQVLSTLQSKTGKTADDWILMGKSHFMLADYKKASEAFEKAASLQPTDSSIYLWLGRSYGRRAESANVFSAPGLASKSRQHFEKAVELDPSNGEALNDLFEYYLEAPGFLGGGEEKAQALISKIREIDPAEAHFAAAKLAESRKDWNKAEQQLSRAFQAAPGQIGRALDLAKFLARRGKIPESELAFKHAEKIDPNSPQLLFTRAQTYIEGNRNKNAARAMLERYLKSQLSPDDPPRAEAERLLRQTGGD